MVMQSRALESIAYSGELGVRQLIQDAYYWPDEGRRLTRWLRWAAALTCAGVTWHTPSMTKNADPLCAPGPHLPAAS